MANNDKKYLIVIAGPTAVGKTAAAIKLAKYFDTEIVSADSRQIYREMSIGTAKPTPQELSMATYHLINHVSIHEPYDVGTYAKQALQCIDNIFNTRKLAILSGGTGLYIHAVCHGLDTMPAANLHIRNKLNNDFDTSGIEPLQIMLKTVDPVYYNMVDIHNHVRIIRALEVYFSTQIPFSQYLNNTKTIRPFEVIKIALRLDKDILNQKINIRTDDMIQAGLVQEAQGLYKYRTLSALKTVGYEEIFDYLDHKTDLQMCTQLIKKHTAHYAKKQLTWLRKDEEYKWFEPGEYTRIIDYICSIINK
ncbi:MAG: tRNA (adenosine(37)-N6)-dimethylallyltransferase MiaA [Cytophagales bacterium]|nr:tRNA (adenosine(37)-N6)-dimethylallyltransferase MiaA [Cytophagales bacterium]